MTTPAPGTPVDRALTALQVVAELAARAGATSDMLDTAVRRGLLNAQPADPHSPYRTVEHSGCAEPCGQITCVTLGCRTLTP